MYRTIGSWRRIFLFLWFFVWMILFWSSFFYEYTVEHRRILSGLGVGVIGLSNANSSEGMKYLIKLPINITPSPIIAHHFMSVNVDRGRLGNHIFTVAALIGIADKHRYTPVLQRPTFLQNMFDLKFPIIKIMNNSEKFNEKRAGMFDERILNISHNRNWTLHGYFQSWRYFSNSADAVRKQFTFKSNILHQANKLMPVKKEKIRIGVHVRRGDMNTKRELKRGYNVADFGYLNRSMNYFRRKFGGVTFVVVSDDLTWCRKYLTSADVKIVRTSREVDFAILSLCDHNIVTTGSYGWWGAWLAGGETVYFKDFPTNNTWLDKQYNKSDYYPTGWIGM